MCLFPMETTWSMCGAALRPPDKPDTNTALPAGEREIGGAGVLMTRKSIDDAQYQCKNVRNILTLKKHLA